MRAVKAGDSLGRYQLTDELGQGGMAVVFRADDPTLGREVAIKVMLPHMWGQVDCRARFIREARAAAALRHRNIVEVFDFGEGGEDESGERIPGFIVSELVNGPTLQHFIDEHGYPLPEVAAMIVHQLAGALQCAHDEGIIHRDLKPENVMIAQGGRVVLTDFGIARIAEGDVVTQTGAMVGSPAYMSPEQARGLGIDHRSDLFSLGTMFYKLCTRSLPFQGKDPLSTVLRVLEGKYEPPVKRDPRVGGRMERVIKRLLQVDPDDRHASAGELREELEQLLLGAEIEDVEEHLQRYFASPQSYSGELVPKVVSASLVQAREASDAGNYATALSLCDRVLAFEPEDPEANRLIEQLTARGGRRRLALGLGLLLLVALSGGGLYLWLGAGPPSPFAGPDGGVGPDAAVVLDSGATASDLGPLDAAAPDVGHPDARRVRHRPRPAKVKALPPRPPDARAPRPPDRAVVPRDTRAPVAPSHAWLKVRLGPWCEVWLDGKKAGISPMKKHLRVAPGKHRVVCRFHGGARVERVVQLSPGERRIIKGTGPVTVTLRLARGRVVRLDSGRFLRPVQRLEPKRYRMDLMEGGKVIKGGWVTIPSHDCTLVSTPELKCR